MVIEIQTQTKHFVTKEQIISFVEEVSGKKLVNPVLSRRGLKWESFEEIKGEL